MCGGNADVDGLALELLRLPVGLEVGDHPIAHFGVADIECAGLGVECGLRPVGPDAEAKALAMRFVGDEGEAVGEFFGIGIPVADAAEPAGVNVEHLQAQFLRLGDHAQREGFVHLHAAAPAVVDHEGILRVFPGKRIAEDCADPGAELVSGAIRARR